MKKLYTFLAAALMAGSVSAQNLPTKTITDTGAGTGTVTWSKDTVYILDGFVFVNDGDTLTIEPGAVIKGMAGTGEDASALIVAAGGYLSAKGTATEPIIFTSENDDVTTPSDLDKFANGQWGGVIMLGKACLNTVPTVQRIEGIPETEDRGRYGQLDSTVACDDTWNAGELSYISIRHGGSDIGANNEINGLTMGGVGTGTKLSYIEVYANKDDGFEWFGGTASTKYLISAFVGDDCFDYDQGWRGKNQFWFAIHQPTTGGHGGEHDGGTSPESGEPFATPTIVNATYIGQGPNTGRAAVYFRDNAGGFYHNSIFTDWGRGIFIEVRGGSPENTLQRLKEGDLALKNNIFYNLENGDQDSIFLMVPANYADTLEAQVIADSQFYAINAYNDGNNSYVDPQLVSISRDQNLMLDPRPAVGSPALDASSLDSDVYSDAFFTTVDYKGAFDNSGENFWAAGWTALSHYGFLRPNIVSIDNEFTAELNMFPNPTTSVFNIVAEGLEMETVTIAVFDNAGRMVSIEEVTPAAGSIDVAVNMVDAPAGIYTVRVQQGAKVAAKRVIKQ
ncbi:T9SS type A sorting domain-containing protein [Pontibacter sp. G13]|uniref:T9SS type A sorting domain-containing protein n=1 Tax=Pontibacter sp. G13 TaxID=3074898 RepID=UPI00288B1146|nr:T9SS type A sorting domain-containing protein [Pontibacter sp. G13]WNJ19883.1 T9SS type A sorting domain-containing protein [Pontibacter sp. G13]